MLLVASVAWAGAAGADEAGELADPDLVIVEDDVVEIEDDDAIIIVEEGDEGPTFPRISGPLGRLWEALHVGVDASIEQQAQLVSLNDLPVRSLAAGRLESWILPAPNLSFYANGFARVTLDVGPGGVRLLPIADLYEAYAKVNAPVGSVLFGRLVVPWGATRVAALGDRLTPPDHRRAPGAFPDAIAQRQPQWGVSVRTSLAETAVELVLMTLYEPSEGSLAASDQGGVRTARYQTALIRSPSRAGGLFADQSRDGLVREASLFDATTAGARVRRRVGDFDVGASAVYGVDEVPTLHLDRAGAQLLAAETMPPTTSFGLACDLSSNPTAVECLGPGVLSYDRATSFTADAAWGLGIVIVKAEVLAMPHAGGFAGKSAILVDERGLRSARLSHVAGALALEAGFAEWIEGSVEVFDLAWLNVPAGSRLWGVELLGAPADGTRMVHRLAVGANLGGTFFGEALAWHLRGEGGVLQPDVLVSAELKYNLPFLGLHVGGRGLLFTGLPGSPGWFRQDASQVSLFVGEGV